MTGQAWGARGSNPGTNGLKEARSVAIRAWPAPTPHVSAKNAHTALGFPRVPVQAPVHGGSSSS